MKPRAISLFFFALMTLSYGQPGMSDLYAIKFKKVKDNVYVAYRPDPFRIYVEGNVTIIINEHDVVVVDTGGSPTSARNVIAEIKKLTPNPVRYVINTHFHRDHVLGNQEYLKTFPGAEIISHPVTYEKMAGGYLNGVAALAKSTEAQKKSGEEEIKRLREEGKPGNDKVIAHMEQYYNQDIHTRQAEYRNVTITLPTTTIEKKLTLRRGSRTIELLFLGHGDTPADLIVYLPQDKVVCAGDMVVHPIPYGFSEQPLEWLKSLGQLSQLEFDTLIPGHGDVQQGKVYLQRLMSLLQSVQTQVSAAVADGLDLDGVRKRVDLSRFASEFAQDDPLRQYYFIRYFFTPSIEQAFKGFKTRTGQK